MSEARIPTGRTAFLERSAAMEQLQVALGDVLDRSAGRVVVVSGEAGIGKTVLLRAFVGKVPPGVRTHVVTCDPVETAQPLGPLLDLARGLGSDELTSILAGTPRPYELADALLRGLAGTPHVLAIDDLQYADETLLDVLRLLSRRIWDAPVFLLASVRDDGIRSPDAAGLVLGQLASEPEAVRVVLEPLSAQAVDELAALWEHDGEGIHAITGGNPFFVTEVLAAGGTALPATVRDAVLARAGRLTPAARRLLDGVAIAGGPIEVWLLEALVTDVDQLEACLTTGLLVSERSSVRFRHELARRVIEDSLPANRRVALHRRALAVLSAGDVDQVESAKLAYHANGAGDGAALLLHGRRAAARAAALGAHRLAVLEYQRVLPHATSLPPGERAQLLEAFADEALLTGHFTDARTAAREAIELRRTTDDPAGLAGALRVEAKVLALLGHRGEAAADTEAAIKLLEPMGVTTALARAVAGLAAIRGVDDDDVGLRLGSRATELAETVGDLETLALVLDATGVIECRRGEAGGFALIKRSCELLQASGDQVALGHALMHEAWLLVRWRECEKAAERLSAATAHARKFGLDAPLIWLRALTAECDLARGRWSSAERIAEEVRASASGHYPQSACAAELVLARVHARRGSDDAHAHLDSGRRLAVASGLSQLMLASAAASAEVAWLDGRHEDLVEAADQLVDVGRLVEPWFAYELACWRRRAGLAPVDLGTLPEPYASQAAGAWQTAAAWWTAHGCPYEAALALQDRGDVEDGLEALTRLLDLGATRAAAIVSARLRAAGVRKLPRGPRPSTSSNPAGLTAREAEVLELLVAGRSNREIAERLVVSVRTADHHVAAVLRKLGVKDRSGVASAAAKLGLVASGDPARQDR